MIVYDTIGKLKCKLQKESKLMTEIIAKPKAGSILVSTLLHAKLHHHCRYDRHCLQISYGLVARKPVFGVSDKANFKPVSSATETR